MPQIQIKLTDCFPLNQILSHSLLIRRITEPLRITDLLFGEIKDSQITASAFKGGVCLWFICSVVLCNDISDLHDPEKDLEINERLE